jgi:hypothetical protein
MGVWEDVHGAQTTAPTADPLSSNLPLPLYSLHIPLRGGGGRPTVTRPSGNTNSGVKMHIRVEPGARGPLPPEGPHPQEARQQ